ncbi:MAG: 2-oxo acid dehydrogenase subunit E2 [Clostridia bacterium]|nr:2-oxo acid dehydrogenase subunit E2 [Clostridia bacterium]
MFGHRSDGKKVKGMNIIEKAEPFFMPQRIDAVNYITVKVPCAPMDEFIVRERKNGVHYSYMHLLFATVVRVLYTRKKLNRFIMRGTIYQRNYISITMDVKKKLEDEGEDMTLKFMFTGRESLPQIKEIVDNEIAKNVNAEAAEDATTKTAGNFCKLPDFLFRWAMALARWADKHGILPKGLIKASPFHTSCFITNLKSIKLGAIYHHLYNFGTTSMFISMGKEKMEPIVENNKELKIAKILTLGMSLDERVADGFYMGKSLKLCTDLLTNPDSLMEEMPDDGSIPKKMVKKKGKKRISKVKKEKKTKKRKPLKNKQKLDKKMKKKQLQVEE